ncbi:zinc-binding alcohol dehydrogenase family protein [Ferrovibrio xuzhouensis]|uniref:Zinc-type alcohol dehydrogenase-like protein n=1 Tax=Ferrovibrio xuzhouensis TaxID=1576914 RepID=A0ABV7VKP5_9PROT
MKAVGYKTPRPISDAEALIDFETAKPAPQGRDLLVKVMAVAVNPVDTKVRRNMAPADGSTRILGFDAAGIVEAVGPEATLFKPGDAVFYAGDLTRPGTNAEFHLVDERIAGMKPQSLDFPATAALPLTAITAWEMLFHRFGLTRDSRGSILIVGGAGGVGSIAVQLARQLTGLTVLATASRPETRDWVKQLGAHHVIDHSQPMPDQIKALGLAGVEYIFSTTETAQHLPAIVEMIAPQGRFGLIDDPATLDINPFKRKSIAVHWEFMFTRSMFQTADMQAQHDLLNEVARLVDAGTLRTTLAEVLGPINAATLRKAHAAIESGRTRGKLVLAGF